MRRNSETDRKRADKKGASAKEIFAKLLFLLMDREFLNITIEKKDGLW